MRYYRSTYAFPQRECCAPRLRLGYQSSLVKHIAPTAILAALVAASIGGVAHAQMGPGGMGGGMGPMGTGPMQPSGDAKKEGVAEAAPTTPSLLPTNPTLPPPKARRKRWQLFEMGGYFRLRTDWLKNFNLGFVDDPALGGAPFPRVLGCQSTLANRPCNDSVSSANMRLRLEPIFNINETTSVHVQADVYDNLILGSTPIGEDLSGTYTDANRPPLAAFGGSQSPPTRGANSDRDAITVKRAWAEVGTPLGILKAGRMPNHWGLGIWANGGGADPINGTYNYDADHGDTVDRVSFSAQIPGTPLRAMVGSDWNATRLVSNQTSANKGREGHPFDLDDSDDVNGWVGAISKMDSPQDFRDAVDRGDAAFNYGVYFEYKTQDWDVDLTNFKLGGALDPARYVPRSLKTYSPDLWAKLAVGSFLIEAEVVGQLGSVNSLSDQGINASAKIRKFGGVGRGTWSGLDGKLRLGVEGGFATGDQWENSPQGATNIAYANRLGDPSVCNAQRSCTLTQFMFNRDYRVDMILWRHLVGAVTNAAYAKPFLQYDLTQSIMFKLANITSFALKPVSTPGNSTLYGTEFNADLGLSTNRIFAGIAYGVLFPFSAMNHPAGLGYGTSADGTISNIGDAATAHTVQLRLVLTL
jgi:uncharacterized protein (TIGR04551 family)